MGAAETGLKIGDWKLENGESARLLAALGRLERWRVARAGGGFSLDDIALEMRVWEVDEDLVERLVEEGRLLLCGWERDEVACYKLMGERRAA